MYPIQFPSSPNNSPHGDMLLVDSASKRLNARAGYQRPARQRRGPGPGPWCLMSSSKRRKTSATATHTRPLRCPSHHLENPCNVLVGWVSEPQKRHRKRDNAGQPPSRLSGSRSASPLHSKGSEPATVQRQCSRL